MDKYLQNNLLGTQEISDTLKLIQHAQTITLLTHVNPDGDGISACAALEHILKKLNKNVETIYPSKPEVDFKRKPENFLINTHKNIPNLIIICDTATIDRSYYPDIFKNIPLINIDHHISNTISGTYNFVNPNYSSACEVLFFILDAFKHNIINAIDIYVAECLLFGLLSDSLFLQTQSTKSQTLRVAASLMDSGANLYQIKNEQIVNKDPKIIMLWGSIMSYARIIEHSNAIITVVSQKELKIHGQSQAALDGFANFLAQMSNTNIMVFAYQTEDYKTKVSFRSKEFDVNKLAAQFGGGGHKNAAGFLSDQSLDKVVETIVTQLSRLPMNES